MYQIHICPVKKLPDLYPKEIKPDILLKCSTRNKYTHASIQKELNAFTILKVPTEAIVVVFNTEWFKYLTKKNNAKTAYMGFSTIVRGHKELIGLKVIYCPYIFHISRYSEQNRSKVNLVANILNNNANNILIPARQYYTHSFNYVEALQALLKSNDTFIIDIETTGLKLEEDLIVSFAIKGLKQKKTYFYTEAPIISIDKNYRDNTSRLYQLLVLLINQKNKTYIFHNASFDIKFIIRNVLLGLKYKLKRIEEYIYKLFKNNTIVDTKIMTYVCLNSTDRVDLSLKTLAAEVTGDYGLGEEIEEFATLPIQKQIEYNCDDVIATEYLYNKYLPRIKEENQEQIYELLRQSLTYTTACEVYGLPVDRNKAEQVRHDFNGILRRLKDSMSVNPIVKKYVDTIIAKELAKENLKLRKKYRTIQEIRRGLTHILDSDKYLYGFFYDYLKLPEVVKTKTGNKAVGSKAIDKWLVLDSISDEIKEIFKMILTYNEVSLLNNNFISAFLSAKHYCSERQCYIVFGNLNLTGTVSGRSSSNNPNLMNLPNNSSKYAQMVKSCLIVPEGYVVVGTDFDSLEDKISALTTKDENKLAVYTRKYDGHALRAYSYFKDQMPDITEELNQLEDKQ